MLKKVHIKIKKYILRKYFQKKCKQIIKNCEYYYKFFHVMSRSFRYTLVTVKEPVTTDP